MFRVGVDLDGVTFDFNLRMWQEFSRRGVVFSSPQEMDEMVPKDVDLISLHRKIRSEEGFFRDLPLMEGAKEHIFLLQQRYDVYFVSAPELSNPSCCADKLHDVEKHFGKEMLPKTILTTDKTLVRLDVLLDDRKIIAGALRPTFTHVHFTSWGEHIIKEIQDLSENFVRNANHT